MDTTSLIHRLFQAVNTVLGRRLLLTATTVFVYRRTRPGAIRPYKVWGYPLLPAIFVACAGVVLVSSYAGNLKGSLLGTGLILLGLPVLCVVRKIYPEPSAELEGISNS